MSGLDLITTEVIHNYLLSAAREMERNLMRTSYNTIVYEIRDFGLGIYDRHCRLLAEAPGLAIFTRGNDYGLKKTVEFIGEENMQPGDLLLTSYPYWSSAHPMDVLATSPIFACGELVGYTAIKLHWLDLGQKDPGYVLDSVDVFQEGLIMPGLKLYKAGVRDEEIYNLIRFNSRLPDRVIGDMNAQISACRTGEQRVAELVEKFGVALFQEAVEAILDHGERVARARLAALPKGAWTAEDWADDDGVDRDVMLKLRCTVTVTDDEFIVDLERLQRRLPRPDEPAHRPDRGRQRAGLQGRLDARPARQRRPLPAAARDRAAGRTDERRASRGDLLHLDRHPGPRSGLQGPGQGDARTGAGLQRRRHLHRHGPGRASRDEGALAGGDQRGGRFRRLRRQRRRGRHHARQRGPAAATIPSRCWNPRRPGSSRPITCAAIPAGRASIAAAWASRAATASCIPPPP